jgi:D-alanine-D-alanine ligase
VLAAAGVPQVAYAAVREDEWRADAGTVRARVGALGLPVFVKPARLGSSVGISKVAAEAELDAALETAFGHDGLVIAEAFSPGIEVECSVTGLGDPETSLPAEVILQGADWYDYEAKYSPGGVELEIPARVDGAVIAEIQALARETFVRVGCSGLARVDFFVEDGDRVLVNELNTIPGFTSTSVYAKLFDASGIPYVELLERLLALALERHEEERRYRH